jgi:hypothetical protein
VAAQDQSPFAWDDPAKGDDLGFRVVRRLETTRPCLFLRLDLNLTARSKASAADLVSCHTDELSPNPENGSVSQPSAWVLA